MFRVFLQGLLGLVGLQNSFGQTLDFVENGWFVDGPVHSLLQDTASQTLYVGGEFSHVGPATPYVSLLPSASGPALPVLDLARPNADVLAVLADGSGGWYLGGNFTQVGDSVRIRLAHVDSNGQVTGLFRGGRGPNETVRALAVQDSILFVGGDFEAIGSPAEIKQYGAVLDWSNTNPQQPLDFAQPDAPVRTAVSDGRGGWFVGGEFLTYGDQPRAYLAHVDSSGQVSAWNPGCNSTVRSLLLDSGVLYVAGSFTQINGQPRNRLAALDAASGSLLPWNPGANNTVWNLIMVGDTVFIGGTFTQMGAVIRNRLAAVSALTWESSGWTGGDLLPWNPNANGSVYCLAASHNFLYAGGAFTQIGGQSRNRIAALSPADGAVLPWNPGANNGVYAILPIDSVLYLGGLFTSIGAAERRYLAALPPYQPAAPLDSGAAFSPVSDLVSALSWNPSANGLVWSLALLDSTLFAGGAFDSVAGLYAPRIAALNRRSGTGIAKGLQANSTVYTLQVNQNQLFVGGTFTTMGGSPRSYLTAYDSKRGPLLSWNPRLNGAVHALAADSLQVYAGGSFTLAAGKRRDRLVAFNLLEEEVLDWNPGCNGNVLSLLINDSLLYAGGSFTQVGSSSRNRLAAISRSTARVKSWNPNANNSVLSIAIRGDLLYAGGSFTAIGGILRNRLAAVSLGSGSIQSWNPQADATVRALAVSGDALYAGGNFLTIGGQKRNRLVAFNLMSGALLAWNPNADDAVHALAIAGETVLAGGNFLSTGRQDRKGVAAINLESWTLLPWNPEANGSVLALAKSDDVIFMGGDFSQLSGINRSNLGAVDAESGLVLPWNPGADHTVRKLVLADDLLYCAGDFTAIGFAFRGRLAALDLTSGFATAWNPASNGPVRSLLVLPESVFAGGDFTAIGFSFRNRLAELQKSGGAATGFSANVNGPVKSLAVFGDTLLVGGSFTTVKAMERDNLAMLRISSSALDDWNPDANGEVKALLEGGSVFPNLVVAGGGFSELGGQPVNYAGVLDPNGNTAFSLDRDDWPPSSAQGFDGPVNALSLSKDWLCFGGEFRSVDDQPCPYLAVYRVADDSLPEPPIVAICRPVDLVLDSTGQAGINPEQVFAGNSEDPRIQSLEVIPNRLTCFSDEFPAITLILRDQNDSVTSCQTTATWQAFNPPVLSSLTSPASGMDSANGSITLIIQGGNEPFQVLWNTGDTSLQLTNVPPGLYSATATDRLGCEFTLQDSVDFIVEPACPVPGGLESLVLSSTRALVRWQPVDLADRYWVRGRIAGGAGWVNSFPTVTTINLTSLVPGQSYEWQVRVRCQGGLASPFSNIESFSTPGSRQTEQSSRPGMVLPNPADEQLEVVVDLASEGLLTIWDVMGRMVWQESAPKGFSRRSLFTGDWPEGWYVLHTPGPEPSIPFQILHHSSP